MGFIEENFIEPVLECGDFNIFNSLAYALVLIIAVIGVHRLIRKLDIHIDRHFALAILPFILWASSMRVLSDKACGAAEEAAIRAGMHTDFLSASGAAYNTHLAQQKAFEFLSSSFMPDAAASAYSWVAAVFRTPLAYLLTFFFALAVFLLSVWLERLLAKRKVKIPYWKTMLFIGAIAALVNLALLPYRNVAAFVQIVGLMIFSSAFTYALIYLGSFLAEKNRKERLKDSINILLKKDIQLIMAAHYLDASATYVGLKFLGYREQHPVVEFVTNLLGPESFFILKAIVVLPILWYIDKNEENRDFRNFLKIVILILGLAPGLRDMIRIVVGT